MVFNEPVYRHYISCAGNHQAIAVLAQCAAAHRVGVIPATSLRPRDAVSQVAAVAKRHAAAAFVEKMRLQMLLGQNDSRLSTINAALRLYSAFAEQVLGKPEAQLPPTTNELVAFSALFKCSGTYNNYVSALRLACQVGNLPMNGK